MKRGATHAKSYENRKLSRGKNWLNSIVRDAEWKVNYENRKRTNNLLTWRSFYIIIVIN